VIYIILSVLFNTLLFIILKLFSRYNINTIQALVVNYIMAFLTGLWMSETTFQISEVVQKPWYWGSVFLATLFISVFYVTALTAQQNGLSVATVASKMSVIIPVSVGFFIFDDQMGFLKILGIIMALVAVYFTSKKEDGTLSDSSNLFLPILVFLGAGTIDATLKILEHHYLPINEIPIFSSHTFLMAFAIGIIIIGYLLLKYKIKIEGKNIVAGILLGIPNYFALYFIIKMLSNSDYESSSIFTIHNVAIVLLSTLVGIIFFKEKINKRKGFGIALAILAIFLVSN
jgi:drug/metabolite transporter (DMT)-like permease